MVKVKLWITAYLSIGPGEKDTCHKHSCKWPRYGAGDAQDDVEDIAQIAHEEPQPDGHYASEGGFRGETN